MRKQSPDMLTYSNKKEERRNYLLVFLLLFISGNPLISEFPILEYRNIILASILIIYAAGKKKVFINRNAQIWYMITAIIFLFQIIALHYFSYPAAINFLATATCGILIARIIGPGFREAYLNVIYVLCAISFVGQALYYFNMYPGVSINEGNFLSIIVHNVKVRGFLLTGDVSYRNSGMFWEPGAFQGYTMLVFLMYLNNIKELWVIHKRKFIIIIVALITTFSTTAYIALGFLALYVVLTYSRYLFLKVVFAVGVVFCSLYIYSTSEFLGKKINSEVERIEDGDIAVGRIGSATFDWHYIKKHPIIGNSLHNATRYSEHLWFDRIRSFSNGFTDIVAKMGVVFMLVYLALIYKNWHKRILDKIFTLLILVILLQGECFFNYPLFFALPFIIFGTEKQNYKKVVI